MIDSVNMHRNKLDPTLTSYVGPMWAGKSGEMCTAVERHAIAGRRCMIVKNENDTRYNHLSKSGGLITHRGIEYGCSSPDGNQSSDDPKYYIQTITAKLLSELDKYVFGENPVEVIGVDEAQFFPDAPEALARWVEAGVVVKVACLDSDWRMKPFGRVPEILALSDAVDKRTAVCMKCGANAPFTAKISGSMSKIEEVGGKDKYIAVCRRCHIIYGAKEENTEVFMIGTPQ